MEASPEPRACEVCGEALFGNARQRYCSTRCRVSAHRARRRTPHLRLVDVAPLAQVELDEDEDERLQAALLTGTCRRTDSIAVRGRPSAARSLVVNRAPGVWTSSAAVGLAGTARSLSPDARSRRSSAHVLPLVGQGDADGQPRASVAS
jgi:predicted nucleic acid-binding Zn ribbon protein